MSKADIIMGGAMAGVFGLCIASGMGRVDEAATRQVAADLDLKELTIAGPAHFSCRNWYKTRFNAVTAQGKKIEGVVCSGLLDSDVRVSYKIISP